MHGTEPDLYVDTLLEWVAHASTHVKIDVHAHYLPDGYRGGAAARTATTSPTACPQIPEWSADEHVAVMDRLGIAHVAAVGLVARRAPRRRRGDRDLPAR